VFTVLGTTGAVLGYEFGYSCFSFYIYMVMNLVIHAFP